MTINEARAIIDKNVKIAADSQLSVVTLFVKDIVADEIVHMSMFSDSRYEANAWEHAKTEPLRRFGIPYVSYNGCTMLNSSDTFEFDK